MAQKTLFRHKSMADFDINNLPTIATFIDCDFSGVNESNIFLQGCTFIDCDFSNSVFHHSLFDDALFVDSILANTSFINTSLRGATIATPYPAPPLADLTRADLAFTDFGSDALTSTFTTEGGLSITAYVTTSHMSINALSGPIDEFWHAALFDTTAPSYITNPDLRQAAYKMHLFAQALALDLAGESIPHAA